MISRGKCRIESELRLLATAANIAETATRAGASLQPLRGKVAEFYPLFMRQLRATVAAV